MRKELTKLTESPQWNQLNTSWDSAPLPGLCVCGQQSEKRLKQFLACFMLSFHSVGVILFGSTNFMLQKSMYVLKLKHTAFQTNTVSECVCVCEFMVKLVVT